MKIRNLDKKTRNFLAMLFCTLVIVSTIGSSFAANSFAQQLQQAPTITYKSPWNNNMPISSIGSSQPLSNSANTASAQPTTQPQNTGSSSSSSTNSAQPTTQPQSSAATSTTKVDPTTTHTTAIKLSNTKTNTNGKVLTLNHSFVSSKIIGPDRFRFVTSYWTTSDVSRLIDAGRSAGNITSSGNGAAPGVSTIGPALVPKAFLAGFGQTVATPTFNQFNSAGGGALPLSNLQVEVDRGEGFSTLAIVLQYEGVVSLAGITAGLKLPTGFEAQYPLTDDRHNLDIALANYDGGIRPSQEIVLYFPMYVLPNAPVQVPVLGPLALHFLRSAPRSIGDSLDSSDQNLLAKALSVMNTNATSFVSGSTTSSPSTTITTTSTPSGTTSMTTSTSGSVTNLPLSANATTLTTNLNDNLNIARNNINHFGRFIPWDFINQVIPVIFKATGREVLDVYQPLNSISTIPFSSAAGKAKPVAISLTFANHGDVPLFNLVVQLNTVLPVITGAAGGGTSVVAPQLPIVVQGQTMYYFTGLGPGEIKTIPVHISSAINCTTNQALEVDSSYNNVIGVRTEQTQVVGIGTSSGGSCSQQPPSGTSTGYTIPGSYHFTLSNGTTTTGAK
jgi:hypothetical protein